MTSLVYFGTHEFSTVILETLINSGEFEIKLVVTQPDRPVGRKKEMKASPIKILAQKHNLPIAQPDTLKNFIINDSVDFNIVCQYGLLIPKKIIESPKHGSINVHTSLLPKYRGASPIQSALINGEKETGTTIMLMDELLDHGPILSQEKITIYPDETYQTLSDRMSKISAKLLIDTLDAYLKKEITPRIQNHDEATFCKELSRDNGKIDWSKSATEIYNLYRGLTPWPGIWTQWKDKRLKLLAIKPSQEIHEVGKIKASQGKLYFGCGSNSSIEVTLIQAEGKKVMNAKEFINGFGKLI